jgi:hypothetical protein
MARYESLKDKVVRLEMKPHSRKVTDEKYLKRNSLYLVEDEKSISEGWYGQKQLVKLKGINGYRDSVYFKEVPEAIVRDLRIESILKRTKKDVIVDYPIGDREFESAKDKNGILIRLILEKLFDRNRSTNPTPKSFQEIINEVIANDIHWCLNQEDFDGIKDLTFNEVVTQITF